MTMESWAPNSASSEERFAFPSEDVSVKVGTFVISNVVMAGLVFNQVE